MACNLTAQRSDSRRAFVATAVDRAVASRCEGGRERMECTMGCFICEKVVRLYMRKWKWKWKWMRKSAKVYDNDLLQGHETQ